MAGDWIKWEKGLARKPEVLQIAAALKMSRHAAAGLLMEVWEWADDNVLIDENVSGFDPDKCPGSVRIASESLPLFEATFGVTGLADAMTAAGWMIVRSGSLVFPNFARHNGKSAKARALDSSRKRADRAKQAETASGSEPDKSRTREEKRREESKDKEEAPLTPHAGGDAHMPKPKRHRPPKDVETQPWDESAVPLPHGPEFRRAWLQWLETRKAKRSPVTNRVARLQLEKLDRAGLTAEEAANCVYDSAANDWKGLFPEKVMLNRAMATRQKTQPMSFKTAEAVAVQDALAREIQEAKDREAQEAAALTAKPHRMALGGAIHA